MSYVAPEWIEYQRRRFTRHDAQRYWRADADRLMPRETLKALGWQDPYEAEQKCQAPADSKSEAEELEYRWELAKLRLDWELFKLSLKASKAGFNPDQPRVPVGNSDGGRWTSSGGTRADGHTEFSAVRRDRDKGHHYVPRQLFENRPLRDETRKVFEDAKTGRLYDVRSNKYDREHRIYNAAVSDSYHEFLGRKGITSDTMTPDQAREFVREVENSKDPRIRNFNMRIRIREIMHRVLTRTRGNE